MKQDKDTGILLLFYRDRDCKSVRRDERKIGLFIKVINDKLVV